MNVELFCRLFLKKNEGKLTNQKVTVTVLYYEISTTKTELRIQRDGALH